MVSLPAEAVSLDEDISTQQLSVRVVVAMSLSFVLITVIPGRPRHGRE